ncbi:11324_t:CDS:1 [Funneliformis caledonium]|uniref:11324_t:CDS:1 n=1 Tax=Funneliformis caledonium TaxID=1117310 RepID=A0A9N8YQJ8_9GLOM|nr:11324_t:CDS:1 [Funneliformis caledonium]
MDINNRYIYGGSLELLELDVPVILSVLTAADELCLTEIFGYIEDYLLQDFDQLLKHFVQVQTFASQHHHFTKLLAFCVKTMEQDPSIMFEHEDFNLITQETLITLLKCNNLVMREIDLWNKVVGWGRAQDSCLSSMENESWTNENFLTLNSLIQPCIRLINFASINRNDFLERVAPFKQAFNDDFYDQILENYESKPPSNQHQDGIDSVLIDSKHLALICDWLTNDKHVSYQNIPFEFHLLVRGSRNGFGYKVFHELCDLKGPTITILRVHTSGELLGGYNPLNWDSSKKIYYKTNKSFIFSLGDKNLQNTIYSKIKEPDEAIFQYRALGPCFGGGISDLKLYLGFDDAYGCTGNCFKKSYEKSIMKKSKFWVDEYEVFRIIKKIP